MGEFGISEEWNMADAYYKRIDYILWEVKVAKDNNNILNWFKYLSDLYDEIRPKLRNDEPGIAEDKYVNCKNEAFNFKKIQNSKNVYVNIKPFRDFEAYLRKMLDQRDMLTPKRDDPTKAYMS
jgi:hypothetical protein